MTANHSDGQGSRPQPRAVRRTGGAAPSVRRLVVKRYGARAVYTETRYERERRERREGGAS
jgi:hypothetical protein